MRRRDTDNQKLFTRRVAVLGAGKLALLGLLAGRMYFLQVTQADRYALLADENRINMRLLQPSRGRIVDRNGVPLAVNQQNYRVLITSEDTPDVDQTLTRLSRIMPVSGEDRQRIMREVRKKRKFVPVTVREFLRWEDVARIEVNTPDLPGITIDVGQRRFYPEGEIGAHLLGYVAAVSEEDLNGDPLLETPGFRIGRNGIEKQFDLPLRGHAGTSQLEVNALGRVIRELDRREGTRGHEVVLTIDMALQRAAVKRLGDESGAVVALNIHNGEVLTLASTPSFNPNTFAEGLDAGQWRNLVENARAPLRNKATAGEYAPGSTFKMIVALAALEAGAIDESTEFYCNGKIKFGDGLFHCWKREGHGEVRLVRGIRESCDVYFYELAKRIGIDRISGVAERFGLGQTLGLDLPGERRGLIPTRDWKQAVIGERWAKGETLVSAIGQGFVLVTPLQLAVMTARLVNGGKAITPHLVRELPDGDRLVPRPEVEAASLETNPRHLGILREAMLEVTNHARGTAYRSRLDGEDVQMGGKTGTSQVRRITKAERATRVRKNEELEWRERDHALFVAFAPADSPRYAISVVVEHGGSGSKAAAPIARDLMQMLLDRDPARNAAGAGVATSSAAAIQNDA